MLVPLQEILAEAIGSSPTSQKIQIEYKKLTDRFGSEYAVLLEAGVEEVSAVVGEKAACALHKVRSGNIYIDPGYDGVFGVVKIWEQEKGEKKKEDKKEQMSLF